MIDDAIDAASRSELLETIAELEAEVERLRAERDAARAAARAWKRSAKLWRRIAMEPVSPLHARWLFRVRKEPRR